MELTEIPKSFECDIDRHEQIANSAYEMMYRLGLTLNESKVYIYLNKNGSKKANDISQNQKIPRTQIYHLLNELQKKGMVTVISGIPAKFKGIEFEKVLDIFIKNELKKIEEVQLMRDELSESWKENFYKQTSHYNVD